MLIKDTCYYETAWNDKIVSPWCLIMSDEDFETFEYKTDLFWYWVHGYGIPLSYKIACPVLKDMFDFFT